MTSTAPLNIQTSATSHITLTPIAIAKAKEFVAQQNPLPAGLRIGVAPGGCSGFSYSMGFEDSPVDADTVYNFDGLQVFVDATSGLYLEGCTVDYEETLDGAGFIFENPSVKSTCGCGSSFNV